MDKILNPKQIQAIKYGDGPLLIIAGAGTGKTTVVTERIKHLIVDRNIPPASVLALTFTEKAAFEMQERIDVLLPYGYTNLWIHTFHSFCDRILRDEAHAIGLDPNYRLISESESVLLMRRNIFDLGLKLFRPLGNPTKFLDALLTHFSRLKDEDITPEQYIKWAKSNKGDDHEQYLELSNAYKAYEELKINNSLMDFADLISNTLLLFRTRPSLLARYQKQFKFILVDEFQDTNFAQNALAILLSGDDQNITVVADDDQSIYRFRGAAVSNVLQFKKNFPNTQIITLTDNYRSTQIILDAAYNLIQKNNPNRLEVVEKIDKKLKSNRKEPKKQIELIHEVRADDEADSIAKEIEELTKSKYNLSDIAILVRANNHAQMITTALARRRIPYQFLGPGYLFQQEEIKDLIAYLTFLTDLSDTVSLFRVLSMDVFNVKQTELNYLLNYARKKNLTLFETLENPNHSFLSPATQEKLSKFREMVERHLTRSKSDQAGQVLYYFIVDSGLFETLEKTDSVKEERRVQNIAKFFDRIKNFEIERPDANIFTLVEWLTLMLQMGDSPQAADIDLRLENAVNILTVHSSKGLEFKVVFLVNLVNDRFPTRERAEKVPLPQALIKETIPQETDFHLEEERRLFYVGMTRAKERLFLTAADFYGTGKRAKKLSPFIFEALPNLEKEIRTQSAVQQLSLTEVLAPYQNEDVEDLTKTNYKVSYITYSNLQMFDICPLHYRAKVILKIPTPPTAVQSFGISLHNTLYQYYKLLQNNEKPNFSNLKEILKREWLTDGYASKNHEKERWNQAQEIIKKYFETELKQPIKPLALELPFNFLLDGGVKVFGKMDRVDPKDGGIEIIDYKTGEENPKAAKAHELQLAMYALAATRVKDPVLDRKPENITLTLHFLEHDKKKSMSFSKDDLDRFEKEVVEKIKEIEASNFKCSKNVICVNCEFRLLCNAS